MARRTNHNTTIHGTNGTGEARTAVVRAGTAKNVALAVAAGATIIINCNRAFAGRGYETVEKLAHTTPKKKGDPHHIVWACYPEKGGEDAT